MEVERAGPGRPEDEAERAVEEFARRLYDGEAPDPEAFLAAHPGVADRIRERILGLRSVDRAIGEFVDAPSSAEPGRPEPEESPAASPPGRTLGDFRIVREIGRGGMGVVYLAEQVSLRRVVALKVLPAHLTLQEQAIERFHREASTTARLRHPGIVEIHAIGEAEGAHFFAMEFIEGTPLDKVLERMRETAPDRLDGEGVGAAVSAVRRAGATASPPTTEGRASRRVPSSAWNRTYIETVCRVVAQVADALEHAHRAGVIHRDVKPSNILLREDGTAVLTDFGLAREEGLPSMTLTGDFAGTPYYVSPEQAMARRMAVDHRTDVFSLGVTLFELLTLRRPFEGRTAQEVLGRIVAKEPSDPGTLNPFLPRDLVTIVLTAIEKDPDRRYASAGAFGADLLAFLSFKPIVARPSPLAARALKLVRRHRAATAAAASVLLAALGAGAWWWFQPGYLAVTSPTAGAMVFVDGEPRGTAPLEVALEPGVHRVRLEKGEDLVTEEEAEVVIRRAARRQIERTLSSRNGVLSVESEPPGARVALLGEGGREIPVPSPTPTMLDVRAGRYRARFALAGFPAREVDVEVFPGGVRTPCRATWETGGLLLEGFQKGAQVEVHEGDRIGTVPPPRVVTMPLDGPLRLPAATYSLRARLPDHDRADLEGSRAVRVEPAATARATLWLRPIERRFEIQGKDAFRSLLLADLDEDGLPEIFATKSSLDVVALSSEGAVLRVWRVPELGWPIQAADLDGAGRQEILVVAEGRVLALSSEGAVAWRSELQGRVSAFAAVDLAGDARPEILVGTEDGWIRAFSLDGTAIFERKAEGSVTALEAVDVAGDRRPEIVVGTEKGHLLAFSSDGSPLFEDRAESILGLAGADLDSDGRPEVVLGTWAGRILARTVEGPLRPLATTATSIRSFAAADLDVDGRTELVAGTVAGEILVFAADGSVRFETKARGSVSALAIGDTDGNGRPEIFAGTAGGQLLSLASDPSLLFEADVGAPFSRLIAGDLDRDGKPELVVGGRGKGGVTWLEGDGSRWRVVPIEGGVHSLLAADLDGDGRAEAVAGTREGRVVALSADGSRPLDVELGDGAWCLGAADLEGDGRCELLVGTMGGRILALAFDGSRRLERSGTGYVHDILGADLDRDGRPEVVAATEGGEVLAFHADGSPAFAAALPALGFSLAAGDLDGDGSPEVVAGTRDQIAVFSGDGSPRFTMPATGRVNRLAVADLEDDGRPEIVAGSWGRLAVFSSDGTPRFATQVRNEVWSVLAADLDGDRRKEVLAASWAGDIVAVASDGALRFRANRPTEVRGLAALDLDGDGRMEILAGGGDVLAAYSLDPPDPRAGLRRDFLEALDAAERGDEAAAESGFERARFSWLGLDDSRLGAIRTRLVACRGSPSAQRMAEILGRIRPASAIDWVEGVDELVRRGRIPEALAVAKERFADVPRDSALAQALDGCARSWIDPGRPRSEARQVALVLADAAAAASGREVHGILDTLAEALSANGRFAEAVEVAERILEKCPAGDSDRARFEASLVRFRHAAMRRPPPVSEGGGAPRDGG